MAQNLENEEVMFPELFAFDDAGKVRLVGGYSKESDNWTFPKYMADPISFSDEIEEKMISAEGELHSFTAGISCTLCSGFS